MWTDHPTVSRVTATASSPGAFFQNSRRVPQLAALGRASFGKRYTSRVFDGGMTRREDRTRAKSFRGHRA